MLLLLLFVNSQLVDFSPVEIISTNSCLIYACLFIFQMYTMCFLIFSFNFKLSWYFVFFLVQGPSGYQPRCWMGHHCNSLSMLQTFSERSMPQRCRVCSVSLFETIWRIVTSSGHFVCYLYFFNKLKCNFKHNELSPFRSTWLLYRRISNKWSRPTTDTMLGPS